MVNRAGGKVEMTVQIFSTIYKSVRLEQYIKDAPSAPYDFPQKLWSSAKGLAQILKEKGVKCQVLRGNGSTSPAGSNKATNFFTVEKDDETNKLYLNFDMTDENAENIIKVLKEAHIPFVWEGDLGSCITFSLSPEGYPE